LCLFFNFAKFLFVKAFQDFFAILIEVGLFLVFALYDATDMIQEVQLQVLRFNATDPNDVEDLVDLCIS
jgi:hypothetical protein